MRESKVRSYAYGFAVTIVVLSLYSYYVRELLATLALFSIAFVVLALVALTFLLLWTASEQVALWTRPASRNAIAYSRRLVASNAKQ